MDKFLLAENPMRPESSGLYVVHLLQPVAIFACLQGHVQKEGLFGHYGYRNKDGVVEEWTLSVHHFYTTDFLKEPADQVKPIMDRAWRWLRAYLEFEDNNIDTDEYGKQN